MNWEAFSVFAFFFILVTVIGFVAARWRRGDLNLIDEWGLAGRRFGTVVTWFLLGGDLYTAYTFIAVPAAMYGIGALNGFFAVPYTILVYPLVYVLMPRFWSVCKQHNFVTAADFVKARFGSRSMALAVSFTGILATMPYIALQMFGIQISLAALGVPLSFNIVGLDIDIPLLVAFLILAAYTYTSGLRAPAMIALVKDIMIFIVLFATIIIIPAKLGGFGAIFDAAQAKAQSTPGFADLLSPNNFAAYTTLAIGSALALFLYPHSQLGVLASNERRVIKRNAALLPIYSLMLGMLALLGYMAIAAKVTPLPGFGANGSIPALINNMFPAWFAGFAFAAISIGALVPAAAMSIAAANTFTRNIYVEFIRPKATTQEESQTAKLVSFIVKFGALLFIIYIPTAQVINYQLLGGIWIMQILPAVFLGLYTHWFNRWAMLVGWAAGMIAGTSMFLAAGQKSIYAIFDIPLYAAVSAVVLNLVLTIVLTPVFEAIGAKRGADNTHPDDYEEAYSPVEPRETGREVMG